MFAMIAIALLAMCSLVVVAADSDDSDATSYTHTIIYNANGGSGAPSTQTVTNTSAISVMVVSSTIPVRSGYIFNGWSQDSTATEALVEAGGEISIGDSITYSPCTLYAIWVVNTSSITHTLIYNANGGSGAPSTQTITDANDSATFTVSSTVPTRSGFTFLGWNIQSTSTTSMYDAGETISVGSSFTLYAVWSGTHTIYYNGNGGSPSPATQSVTDSNSTLSMVLSSTVPVRSGYTFEGWSTSVSATVADYSAGETIVVGSSAVYLFAVWSENTTLSYTHIVLYDANGGTGAPSTQTITDSTTSTSMTVSTTEPTRTGYTFIGWSASSSATSATYYGGDSISVINSITLYAVWVQPTLVSVTFNVNGGGITTATLDQTVLSGNSIYLPITEVTRSGYYLAGWNAGSTSGTLYAAGSEYVVTAAVTLYANWVAINTNVLDSNAPSSINVAEQYSYSPEMLNDLWYDFSRMGLYTLTWINHPSWLTYSTSTFTCDTDLPLVTRTAMQYIFSGTPAEVGVYYVEIQMGTSANRICWTITVSDPTTTGLYIVSFSAGDGEGSHSSITGSLGSAIILPSSGFTEAGYKLAYWSTTIDGTTVYYPLGSIYTITGSKTFTAYYVADEGIIIFDANGGIVTDTSSAYLAYIVQTDGVVTTPSSGLTKTGYTFAGWYLSSDTTAIYALGYLYGISSVSNTIVMLAYWIADDSTTYNVIYNANGGLGSLTQTIESGKKAVMPTSGYTYTGHSLSGWNTVAAGTGTSYALGGKVSIVASITIYAQWGTSSGTTEDSYSVTFDLNGSSGSIQSQSVSSGGVAVQPEDPEKAYYAFLYWQLSGSTGEYDFSTGISSDIVLKAVWIQLFTMTVSGTKVTLQVSSNYAAGTTTVDWGDGSDVTTGSNGKYTHTYEENTSGTIDVRVVVRSGSDTTTYTSYAGYSVDSTITTPDPSEDTEDSDSFSELIVKIIIVIIVIIIAVGIIKVIL